MTQTMDRSLLSEQMRPQDPFNVVRDEVDNAVAQTTQLYTQWQSMLEESYDSGELQKVAKEITEKINGVNWDLQDLQETIDVVEKNRQKFKIDHSELENRKAFIVKTHDTINRIKADIDNPQVKHIIQRNARSQLMKKREGVNNRFAKLDQAIEQDNDKFVQNETQIQQQIVSNQNADLDQLHTSVVKLGQMGEEIHEELNLQGKILDDLEHEVEKTDGRLVGAIKRVNRIIDQTSDTKSMIVIIVLIIILAAIVLAVIFL
eukprot:TRINITY_DN8374_c0_g1_i1.p4 TRINITY_DN8374_c0_g1~~TRINITY_DN8374_c0_g1_i1.p4  ORF type:complete len:276 (-),score=106.45 TRINITY_DN8374_c0_g1_i1:1556-2338(-)